MSVKAISVPTKILSQSITASATSFRLNDIQGWDGVNLTSASFGTQAYGVFRNAARTQIELFEFDPTTIASTDITIVLRGLKYDGDLTTSVSGNKYAWTKGDTYVDIGTDTPQIFQYLLENVAATATNIGTIINAATSKNPPIDADTFPITDTAASNVLKKVSFANLKTFLANTFLSLSGGTLTGNIQLGENTSIDLDAAGSADGKYSGICIAGTAGTTLAFGDLVYLAVADSRWELTDADATATAGTPLLGMCVLAAAADGNATKILLHGNIRADAKFPTLTVGAPAYVGETAGAIQTAIPTGADNVIRVVGRALTADELYFNPSQDHQVTVA